MWMTIVEAVRQLYYRKMDQDKEQQPFALALQTAELALQHAADTGKEIPKELVLSITDAKYRYKNSSLDSDSEASFWEAFTKLRVTLGLESLRSITPQASVSALRMRSRYGRIGIFLLILLIPLSVISLTGDRFITDIEKRIITVCDDKEASALDCIHHQVTDRTKLDTFFLGATTEQIYSELWWLNIFMRGNSTGELVKIYYPPQDFDREFFESIWAARLIEARFQSFMQVINGVLPIIYTILGAVAFGVRDLRTRSSMATWTVASEVGANLRLLLAVFVGAVIGIFTDFAKGASLPPIAVGFLAGYGVEFFFEFLDNLLKTFGFRSAAEARPPG
jgi:hypothetical protein